MPGFDRTGPEGQGAMTGRGLGRCGSRQGLQRQEGDQDFGPSPGRGFGRGLGRRSGAGAGRGRGRGQGRRGGRR